MKGNSRKRFFLWVEGLEVIDELFELTQRKFLRVVSGFAEAITTRSYPRLFALDYMSEKEISAQELSHIEMANQRQQENEDDNERDLEGERRRDDEVRHKQEPAHLRAADDDKKKEIPQEKFKILCIRALCENEQNWHSAGNPFEVKEKVIIQNSTSYLSKNYASSQT